MIKNFIYLDEQKLYSFSSQLFEGITDYVLNERVIDESNQINSKEKLLSSKKIADVIRETSQSTEKKFLHDHAFNLFENELISSNKLIDCHSVPLSKDNLNQELKNKSFIKISATAKFLDTKYIADIFEDFRTLAESFATAELYEEMRTEEAKIIVETDKTKRAKLSKTYETNLRLAIHHSMFENDSFLPEKFVQSLNYLLNFGYQDDLYLRQVMNEVLFSSLLDRRSLRGSISDIIHKYGRITEKKFIVLGVVSHGFDLQEAKPLEEDELSDSSGFKDRIANLSEHLTLLEQNIRDKQDNEIIIDPIAIYTEL
ncbi:hypothetical protein L8R84_18240 [Vibrio splendidus]|uniref:DUF6414 family protein n=1 Tax=Vibrio splendidus TaxID=29497 RepID=UPI00246892DB|nr:hypothetical protein [Vibrio splendidus]MDH5938060.1 hypothetical protein [Vibrio splendidus]